MDFLEQFLYQMGFFGPFILIGLVIASLIIHKYHNYRKIIMIFILFQILNSLLMELLKNFLKQPRPDNGVAINALDNTQDYDPYGMPSGHAQSVFFSLVFIILFFKDIYFNLVAIFGAILSVSQRYIFRKHTFLQLFVGSLLGSMMGYACYQVVQTQS